jgi:MoxR domain in the MoxR-vWA-beta-propeller ternary systems
MLCCCKQARLMLLAALSGEHILFIGPPGTAKSELGRRLSRLYNGPFFERLLTRFSVPEVGLAQLALCAIALVIEISIGPSIWSILMWSSSPVPP